MWNGFWGGCQFSGVSIGLLEDTTELSGETL